MIYAEILRELTLEETFDSEIADTEAQDRKFVQLGYDVRWERKEAGQVVQFCIQTVSVSL